MVIFPELRATYICIERSLGRNEVRSRRFSSSGRKCHVERIVASEVHGTRIGQMERERLDRLRVRIIHIHAFIAGSYACTHVYTYGSEREIEEMEVGGPLPPGMRGLRNNRIHGKDMHHIVKKKTP